MLKSKKFRVFAGVFLAIAVASVAYAYWSSQGSGTGAASAGTTSPVTVTQTSTIAGLYPGGPAQTLSGKFNNPNPGAVRVANVVATLTSVSNGTADGTKPACTVADFTLANATATVNAEIPSGNGVGSWTGPTVALNDSGTNQDNCKNATVNISYVSN